MIGGEFEVNSISNKIVNCQIKLTKGSVGTWTTNGRSALYLILQHFKDQGGEHIHLPSFLCHSILQPVLSLELDYSFYPVCLDFTCQPEPTSNSAVLLIHNFGFINDAVYALRSSSGEKYKLIEDATHVFLNDDYFNGIVDQQVFFSTRKHGPTVLGGWCNLNLELNEPCKEIELNAWKSLTARLIKKHYMIDGKREPSQQTEDIYLKLFKDSEELLDSAVHPAKLPQIIPTIIDNIQWDIVSQRRRSNWKVLHELIGERVETVFQNLPDGVVPLGYVVRLKNRDRVKEKLATKRIFAPIHWRLPDEVDRKKFPDSAKLSDTILTLPIDQRYGQNEMRYIADSLNKVL